MSLFRSEARVQRWLERTGRPKGAILPLCKVWELARAWYTDPRDPQWRPRRPDESQRILASVGLTGDFWELAT